jgi:hypothetical protein
MIEPLNDEPVRPLWYELVFTSAGDYDVSPLALAASGAPEYDLGNHGTLVISSPSPQWSGPVDRIP